MRHVSAAAGIHPRLGKAGGWKTAATGAVSWRIMIRSMTGFGQATAHVDQVHWAVELRALNNKYFKVMTRLPEELVGTEPILEGELRKLVARGSFTISVKLRVDDELAASRVNDAALKNYLGHLETVKDQMPDGQDLHIDMTQLLVMPGVLQPSLDHEAMHEKARPVLKRLLAEAVERLNAMRQTEGRALAKVLEQQLEVLTQRVRLVAERSPGVLAEYQQRLRQRMDELAGEAKLQVDRADLVKELAVFAERSDISEELARMEGHVEHFRAVLGQDLEEPAGRTLDFLTQEMLREANTMGSKSHDAVIAKAVVEAKTAIDRIKEQVQNVE